MSKSVIKNILTFTLLFFIVAITYVLNYFYEKNNLIPSKNTRIKECEMTKKYIKTMSDSKMHPEAFASIQSIRTKQVDSINYPAVGHIYRYIIKFTEDIKKFLYNDSDDEFFLFVKEMICHLILIKEEDEIDLECYEDYVCNVLMKDELSMFLDNKFLNAKNITCVVAKRFIDIISF